MLNYYYLLFQNRILEQIHTTTSWTESKNELIQPPRDE